MQPERAVLPELDLNRRQAEAGPVRRARDCAIAKSRSNACDIRFKMGPVCDRARLIRSPGADLALARAGREIGVGFFFRNRRNMAAHAHLAAQAFPVEQNSGLRVGDQLAALRAFKVGVKNEAAVGHLDAIEPLQQHHAHVGETAGVAGCDCHAVGIVDLSCSCFFEPGFKAREWLCGGARATQIRQAVRFGLDVVCGHDVLLSCLFLPIPAQPAQAFTWN
jgi:hypothetical protein